MQLLFQIDVRGVDDSDAIRDALLASGHAPNLQDEAFALAQAAWQTHEAADAHIATLAPDWPAYRQPPTDRSILRLAYHELITGRVHPRIAINEAVELAKTFCAEESPPFINGVLDKLHRTLRDEGKLPAVREEATGAAGADAWLADARHATPQLETRNSKPET